MAAGWRRGGERGGGFHGNASDGAAKTSPCSFHGYGPRARERKRERDREIEKREEEVIEPTMKKRKG